RITFVAEVLGLIPLEQRMYHSRLFRRRVAERHGSARLTAECAPRCHPLELGRVWQPRPHITSTKPKRCREARFHGTPCRQFEAIRSQWTATPDLEFEPLRGAVA